MSLIHKRSNLTRKKQIRSNWFIKSSQKFFSTKNFSGTAAVVSGILGSALQSNVQPYGQPIPPGPFVSTMRRITNATLLMVALSPFVPLEAKAIAEYKGDLNISILFPGAKTNLFGYGTFPLNTVGALFVSDNASADFGLGSMSLFQVPIVPPPPDGQDTRNGRNITGATVSGSAGPGDDAYSLSQGGFYARLANISGSGVGIPAPPAQIFNADFDIDISYALSALVDNLALEYSEVEFEVYVLARPKGAAIWTKYFSKGLSISNNNVVLGNVLAGFTVPTLPNSITEFTIQYYLQGQALSVALPPLPFPPPLNPPPPVPPSVPGPLPIAGIFIAYRTSRNLRWRIKSHNLNS